MAALYLIVYAIRRRPLNGTFTFSLFMFALGTWGFAHLAELLTVSWRIKFVLVKVQAVGIAFAPMLWLIFVMVYTEHKNWLRLQVLALLSVVPVTTMVLLWLGSYHQLIWTDIRTDIFSDHLPLLSQYGPALWVFIVYGLATIMLSGFLIIHSFSYHPAFRNQSALVSFCILVPTFGIILHVMHLPIFTHIQPAPIALSISMLLAAYTIPKYRLFRSVPAARQRLVDRMQDGVMVIDSDGRIKDLNTAAQRILGRNAEAVLDQPAGRIFTSQPRLLAAYHDDTITHAEIELLRGDDWASYELTKSPLYDRRSGVGGQLLVLHDITDRKKLEKIRLDLTYTMIHDLRNPITSNLSMLQLLENHYEDLPTAERQEMIAAALTSMESTLKLVDQIMEINSLESGQVPIERSVFQFAPLASDTLQAQFSLAAEKELSLDNDVPMDLPPVWADPNMIGRVMQNLIGNAVKFTPPGGVVRVAAQVSENERLQIYVEDSGLGIPLSLRDRLFEKFAVGNSKERGSGLGLAFCKMVLEEHGEDIWVERSSSRGTVFAFTLPLANPDQVQLNGAH
ncbi:MAG: PAS domain-containing protein [Anaerolineales bacterium]|nr:PAS domain-containing protein [Anaerolineales bacterium]